MNKKAFLLAILVNSATVLSHGETQSQLDEFLKNNNTEMMIIRGKMKEIDLAIQKSEGDENIRLNCEKRKVTREFVDFLKKTGNSKEIIELSKEDNKFIEVRNNIKIAEENYKNKMEQEDEQLRNEMKVGQEMKMVTIDYICENTKD